MELKNGLDKLKETVKEEEKKENEENELKRFINSKLSVLNSLRRELGMASDTYEKYKNMKKDDVESQINTEIEDLKQKKNERKLQQQNLNNGFSGSGGGSIRAQMVASQYGKQINPLIGGNPNGFERQINGTKPPENSENDKPSNSLFTAPVNKIEEKYQRV